ncbi:MAG: hypothetical protein GOV15_01650, partial [Candidatus Diapherotrites archaeon]|nr:hypothetical protein [Candidatus Diapherotrites archaeon]
MFEGVFEKKLMLGLAVALVALTMGCTLQLDVSPEAVNISKVTAPVENAIPTTINLAIIGEMTSDLNSMLLSPSGKSIVNNFTVFQTGQVRSGTLSNYNVALVTRPTITRSARTELTRFIETGGGIILMGEGAYLEDDELLPWNTSLGAYIPVLASVSLYYEPLSTYQVRGRLVPSPGLPEPEVFKGFLISNEDDWTLYDVISRPGSEEIGFVEQSS